MRGSIVSLQTKVLNMSNLSWLFHQICFQMWKIKAQTEEATNFKCKIGASLFSEGAATYFVERWISFWLDIFYSSHKLLFGQNLMLIGVTTASLVPKFSCSIYPRGIPDPPVDTMNDFNQVSHPKGDDELWNIPSQTDLSLTHTFLTLLLRPWGFCSTNEDDWSKFERSIVSKLWMWEAQRETWTNSDKFSFLFKLFKTWQSKVVGLKWPPI